MEMKTLEELHGNDKRNRDRAIKGEGGGVRAELCRTEGNQKTALEKSDETEREEQRGRRKRKRDTDW